MYGAYCTNGGTLAYIGGDNGDVRMVRFDFPSVVPRRCVHCTEMRTLYGDAYTVRISVAVPMENQILPFSRHHCHRQSSASQLAFVQYI